jgi:serine/threonine-protein kinase
MELHSLGKFRLVAPFSVRSALCRFYLARQESDLEEAPPTYLAKLLLPSTGSYAATLRAQFEHEIGLMRAFNHHSIPSVHAAGEQDGVAYLVMDRVDGIDLAQLLGHGTDTPRGVSKEVAVYIMGQLADALRHVHALEELDDENKPQSVEVIHRDICPGNVLLSTEGDVLLSDFGAAASRWLEPEHDMAQAGHKAYMAPERVSGSGGATQKTDLFAMAVILWEMLRGQRCFGGEDDLKVMDEIVRFDISKSSRRVSGLSPKLSDILRKNLDRDPGRRYTGAYQMLQRLAQAPEAQAAEQSRLELAQMVSELKASAHGDE